MNSHDTHASGKRRSRRRLHSCEQKIASGDRERLLACCIARMVSRARSTVLWWVENEGLPCVEIPGRGTHRLRLFKASEVNEWLDSRRRRHDERSLNGERYAP